MKVAFTGFMEEMGRTAAARTTRPLDLVGGTGLDRPMFRKAGTVVHFVGIGGMGMCGIAEVLINMGYKVSGSDLEPSRDHSATSSPSAATVHYGHRADNLADADVVVVSSAIKGYNPEVEAARARLIPVIPRAEMLGELMRMKFGIAVAGSHGKTTTTTMIAAVLMAAGLDPTAVIGGRVNSLGLANARWGKSEYLVAEADESDGSFLTLAPTVAVVTNIDAEHLDHYGTLDNVKHAFIDFINRVPFYGLAALCIDNPIVQSILPDVHKRFVTYGLSATRPTYRARNVRHDGLRTTLRRLAPRRGAGRGHPRRCRATTTSSTRSRCWRCATSSTCPSPPWPRALAEFEGIQRRFTVRGEVGGVTIVDDFGHHPAEVRATLSGARAGFPGRRIVAAFQPHRYTRTRDQFDEFTRCVRRRRPAGHVRRVRRRRAAHRRRHQRGPGRAPSSSAATPTSATSAAREDVAAYLAAQVDEGDIVITLGAGDIQLTCNELIDELEARGEPARLKNLARR